MKNIYTFHGWSYNASFWTGLADFFPNDTILGYDRGYWYGSHTPPLCNRKNNIAITHSMGIFFLTGTYDLTAFDKIIIINGFGEYTPLMKKKLLMPLLHNIQNHFDETLQKFRHNIGDTDYGVNNRIPQKNKFLDDITLLLHGSIVPQLQKVKDRIIHIYGQKDRLISYKKSHIPSEKHYSLEKMEHFFNIRRAQELISHLQKEI